MLGLEFLLAVLQLCSGLEKDTPGGVVSGRTEQVPPAPIGRITFPTPHGADLNCVIGVHPLNDGCVVIINQRPSLFLSTSEPT